MTKLYILQEIKRTAEANRGRPLGKVEFESRTGITRFEWFGVYWARWSDALREAGCVLNHVRAEVKRSRLRSPHSSRSRATQLVRLA